MMLCATALFRFFHIAYPAHAKRDFGWKIAILVLVLAILGNNTTVVIWVTNHFQRRFQFSNTSKSFSSALTRRHIAGGNGARPNENFAKKLSSEFPNSNTTIALGRLPCVILSRIIDLKQFIGSSLLLSLFWRRSAPVSWHTVGLSIGFTVSSSKVLHRMSFLKRVLNFEKNILPELSWEKVCWAELAELRNNFAELSKLSG